MRWLVIILLFSSCSANFHYKKLVKKDPSFLKEVVQASVHYIHDTVPNSEFGRVVNTPIINFEAPKTRFEKRIDRKKLREELAQVRIETKRQKLINDSLKTFNKLQEAELKQLKIENKGLKADQRQKNRESFWDGVRDLTGNIPRLLYLLLVILVVVFVIRFFLRKKG